MRFEKDIIIILKEDLIDELKNCVRNASPNEACGFIFGDLEQINNNGDFQYHFYAKKFDCFESNKKSPVSFLIEDVERLNKVLQNGFQKYNLKLISIFHSHPAGSSPSGIDISNMEYLDNFGLKQFKNQIWIIMDGQNFNLNAYIYLEKELLQVAVKIIK